jgi:hypothetical protein
MERFERSKEYSAVLDACVFVPMSLCDLHLRLAEEPALYRPLWSEQILEEMSRALETKLGRPPEDTAWRRKQMNQAFAEGICAAECIPDKDLRPSWRLSEPRKLPPET